MDRLSLYDYELPAELIAQHPADRRDAARLMIVNRTDRRVEHGTIRDLPRHLQPGDCLILNNTRVLPARLRGIRTATGGRWEGLYLQSDEQNRWELLSKTRGRIQPGEQITLTSPGGKDESASLRMVSNLGDGRWLAEPGETCDVLDVLNRFGEVPLPPYIKRDETEAGDAERYQTVFASHPGSVAAPTAGLHFTDDLLSEIRNRGCEIGYVTLHVGIATFRPIEVENLADHQMHAEWCEVPPATVELIGNTKSHGGRVIAVGTTSVRTLESWSNSSEPFRGQTSLFIRPGYGFRVVDAMLTNFHLPKSSLLVMISAFSDPPLMKEAYAEAIAERYRFFSYGDAMLIV